MLKIYFGKYDDMLYSGNDYFDMVVDEDCIETDFGKKVIKAIDNGVVYDKNLIVTEVLGGIPPERLSGGTKALLILMNTDKVMSMGALGDNCLPYLADISEVKDITLCTKSLRPLFENSDLKEAYIINFDIKVHNQREFYNAWVEWWKDYDYFGDE